VERQEGGMLLRGEGREDDRVYLYQGACVIVLLFLEFVFSSPG
jgi:hypothetical protein